MYDLLGLHLKDAKKFSKNGLKCEVIENRPS